MHATSPSPLPFERNRSALNKPIPPSHFTTSKLPLNAALVAQQRPAGLPDELDEYLTVATKPHEIYVSLQDSRDRRFRLLLRRFTNQIQYGCKNPQCDVSTCLSYRKRHATTPVRPYSDVAARALAWRCVEEYADAAKIHEGQHGPVKKRTKAKRGPQPHGSELCWNEPVVPWYDDGSEAARKSRGFRYSSVTATPTGDKSLAGQRHTGSSHSRDLPKFETERSRSLEDLTIWTTSGDQKKASSVSNGSVKLPYAPSEAIGMSDNVQNHGGPVPRAASQRHVSFVEPSQSPEGAQPPKSIDTASFTQTLYNTASMKRFDHYAPSDGLVHNQPSADTIEIGPKPDTEETTHSSPDATCTTPTGSTTTIPRILTFKVLPLSAVLWLRYTLPYDEHLSPHRDLSVSMDQNDLGPFIRQSLYFCLSSPLTLLNSAKTWRFIHQQPHRLDKEKRMRAIKQLALTEQSILRSPHETALPQSGGIILAFGMLVALTSIPDVLGHLFASLQHAYILPPWFKQMQKRDSSTPGNRRAAELVSLNNQQADHAASTSDSATPSSDNKQDTPDFLEDARVAQLCVLVTLALQLVLAIKPQSFTLGHTSPSKDPKSAKDVREQYLQGQKSGSVFPQASLHKAWSKESSARSNYQTYTARLDMMDLSSFQRLLDSLADVISHRTALKKTEKACRKCSSQNANDNVIDFFVGEVLRMSKAPDAAKHQQMTHSNLVDLLRSVISRRWDRKAIVKRRGPVSGALELLAALYRNRTELGISPSEFEWSFVADAFDEMKMPVKWLEFREDSTQTHILSYSFLFEPARLVTYFRSINSMMMKKSYDSASSVFADAQSFIQNMAVNVYGAKEVLVEMRPNMAKFFVLTIRRRRMLQDAIDQIWRRQRQELTRPLKVRLGKDEGEDGLDHGGVQAEFFRLVFAEALNQDYGMFTIDERTMMMWFRPGSAEPLYKFEALGILMSLAVYNGITLPITFPLAFYRKLLGLKVKTLQHIKDGWPDLTRGLQQLLDWQDGDVGQVIARTYEFAYEEFGTSITIDMTKVGRGDPWPPVEHRQPREKTTSFNLPARPDRSLSPSEVLDIETAGDVGSVGNDSPASSSNSTVPASLTTNLIPSLSESLLTPNEENEAPLVTNANRERYVKDYVYWLTDKSVSAQFSSFASGFFTCLDRTALSIFTAEHLKTVVEGHQHIDIDGLQATATYDEYKPTDDVVRWFWQVVRDMPPDRHRKLLEFVTACDRVPVNGIGSVVFIVQRNGDGDERLPSSSTCYGRLLLPRYGSKEVLSEKLNKAIDNSVGFGSL